jgi:hypothetical protein
MGQEAAPEEHRKRRGRKNMNASSAFISPRKKSSMHLAPGFAAFLAASLALLLSACAVTAASTTPVVALPNGYYLQRNKSSDIALVKRSGRTLVRGPIAAYAVHRDVVAGCVGEWPPRAFSYPNEAPFPEHADAEYFVLETKTGQLASDLTLAEWKQHLKGLGVPESFRIVAPLLPT